MRQARHKQSVHIHDDGIWPGLDFRGMTLSEIRNRVRGRQPLRPFQDGRQVDEIERAISELGKDGE